MRALVFGGTGMVGELIVERLIQSGDTAIGVSRRPGRPGWVVADLAEHNGLQLPKFDVVFSAVPTQLFAKSFHNILQSEPKRVVAISSTNLFTKTDSSDQTERASIQELVDTENQIIRQSEALGVEWTILRPTLIYKEGRDQNVTRIARFIQRFAFMPLYGSASGCRQPVHAEDLAIGAIAAAKSPKAVRNTYFTTGTETIAYHEMVGRIFDGLSRPRRLLYLPPPIWKSALALARPFFPGVTPVMGERMLKDMAFDSSSAINDFGWSARKFEPQFRR